MSYADLYLGTSGPLISGNTVDAASENTPNGSAKSAVRDGFASACTVFGIPFDATHSYRPGCRFGPGAIRSAFHNIEVFHPKVGVDLEDVQISDLGDIPHTASASHMLDVARRVTSDLCGRNNDKPVFILGGEHLLTYGTYMAFPKDTAYVVFDAHYDLRDSYGDVSLNHATYLRRIVEGRKTPENILHVGARAFAAEELAFLQDTGIKTISDSDVRSGRGPGMLRSFLSGYDSVYFSFDLDVLDPAFAPGVGNPEADGMTSRELFEMMSLVSDVDTAIAGADIVELNPTYDNGATSSLAAKILSLLVAISVARSN